MKDNMCEEKEPITNISAGSEEAGAYWKQTEKGRWKVKRAKADTRKVVNVAE